MLDAKLLLVSGKGGVGKSAVAAALAISAARTGRRVLAIAMTGHLGLAAHLRVDALPYDPVEVRPGLYGAAVDRAHALDEYLKLQLPLSQVAPTKQLTRALGVLVDTAPGIREIITMGKPIFEVWRGGWDLVVADAPPLGQLMSYVNAPATIRDLVPSGMVQQEALQIAETLADPDASGLILVTTAAELPVIETSEALAVLADTETVALAGTLTNRVLDSGGFTEDDLVDVSAGPLLDAARLQLGLEQSQAAWLEQLPAGPRLPFLFGLLTPGEVAARLADVLEEVW